MTYQILHGSNLDILPTLPDNSVDAIVTDPPYGLSDNKFVAETITRWINGERDFIPDGKGFMGKSWDAFVPPPAVWDECLRVLKPGGHLLAFFGSRTQDIGALSIRLAGFEIRDSIAWMYGSGFPKSLDVSKAIDKQSGYEGEVIGKETIDVGMQGGSMHAGRERKLAEREIKELSPEAQQWEGWGTALKPAFEPIVVARKPLIGTVAENVLTYGTGGLNIDGSRIGTTDSLFRASSIASPENQTINDGWQRPWKQDFEKVAEANKRTQEKSAIADKLGRWPANVILDEHTAELLDEQSGVSVSKSGGKSGTSFASGVIGSPREDARQEHNDSGGASRFFYVADTQKQGIISVCENTPASIVANYFKTIRATIESFAQTSVEDLPSEQLAQAVRSAGIQCDLCGMSIAHDLVALRSLATNKATSTHFQRYTKNCVNSTLTQNLVSLVEQWENIDTIPTTTSFGTLFGCVLLATDESIRLANLESDNDQTAFLYQAKASKRDRNEGLEGLPKSHPVGGADKWTETDRRRGAGVTREPTANIHPTVKPTDLMRYLVKLVTPPGGTVLDPFTGSGSTGKAAILEGFDFIGIELTDEYLPIIEGRLAHAEKQAEEERQKKDEALF